MQDNNAVALNMHESVAVKPAFVVDAIAEAIRQSVGDSFYLMPFY